MMDIQEQIQNANILIVDDNPVNVKLLQEILEQENYTNVYSTTDPRQVKALDQQWHFDVILLDIRMPHMDGFQVMAELADAIENDYLPILIVTAQSDHDTRLQALDKGARDFITKPYDDSEVLHRVRNILEVRVRYKQHARMAQTLAQFFSPEIIEQLAAEGSDVTLGRGVKREAAILMVDLRGFTKISADLTPDELIALVIEYERRMVPIIRRNNGIISRFEGDGILASFGSVVESSTFAADALRAVDGLIAEAASWSAERIARNLQPLDIGAAVTTGPIIFGIIGDEDRLEYTILGNCVNEAAKLEKQTKAERVKALATMTAYEKALEQTYVAASNRDTRQNRTVDGINHSVDLVILAP
jgi:CheY-like chemotaxis protein